MITRTQRALQRRRMSRKIRETVAIRRFTVTLAPAGPAHDERPADVLPPADATS